MNRDQVALGDQLLDLEVKVWEGGEVVGDVALGAAVDERHLDRVVLDLPEPWQVVKHAESGGPVVGFCNGFQIACEAGLLPGALLQNASRKFICRHVDLEVVNSKTAFTKKYGITVKPWRASSETVLQRRIVFNGHWFGRWHNKIARATGDVLTTVQVGDAPTHTVTNPNERSAQHGHLTLPRAHRPVHE